MRAGRAFGPPGTSAAAVFGGAVLFAVRRGPRALFPGPRASSFSAGLPPAPAAENPAWPRLLFEVSFGSQGESARRRLVRRTEGRGPHLDERPRSAWTETSRRTASHPGTHHRFSSFITSRLGCGA